MLFSGTDRPQLCYLKANLRLCCNGSRGRSNPPAGAGVAVCPDTCAPISVLAGSDLPRAGGGPPMFEFTRLNKAVAVNRARQAAQRLAAPAKKAVRSYGSADCPRVQPVSRTWRNLALTAISICATGASLVVTSMVANAQSCNNPGTTNVFTGPIAQQSAVNSWGPSAICGVTSAATGFTTAITTLDIAFLTQTSAFVGVPGNPLPDQMGSGFWIRGVGGQNTVSSTGTATPGPNVESGTLVASSQTRMGFGGFQAGVDLGRFNLGASGLNIVVGITGGLLESTADELIGSGSFKFQVPFVGGYAAATWGNFFADAMLREDFYRVTPPLLGATTGIADVNGNAFNIMGEVGYRFDIGPYFVEPSAGLVWSHLDGFSFTEFGLGGTSPGLGVTLTTNTIDSLIGRAGVRVGTSFAAAGFTWQPFLAASVWDEFEGNATSSAVCNCSAFSHGTVPDTGVNISSTRVGVFGQFGGGTSIQIPNTGWLGFIRGDYRTGDDIHGWDVVGGIRYQFLWAAAGPPAAPMVTKAH